MTFLWNQKIFVFLIILIFQNAIKTYSIMNRVQRLCVCALAGLGLVFSSTAKDNVLVTNAAPLQFQWHEHGKLSWEDFRGPVTASQEESAAATCCAIGFKTTMPAGATAPQLVVYNTFYVNKSWVRPDAQIQSILDHEQGHFDLCELYTRVLRERMAGINLVKPGVKQELMSIYAEVSKEYEIRQQAYEQETAHGTIIAEQKRWQGMIVAELSQLAHEAVAIAPQGANGSSM